ncbi:MAG: NTP/NDP exchange transporter [Holosporaceae bacterium]|jgi:AAA family ATP:ADP antiporter|nr:NTP/NDP exchange transporter [Holosporaceae bacterium]
MSDDKKMEVKEFSGLRSVLWPIHTWELKKFLPMAFMMMCILLNYSLMRATKDALVVTNMGAEAIPTLKLWFVLPAAVLFMVIYSKLSNVFSKNAVFYIIVSSFMVYFALFAMILYPFHKALSIDFSSVSNEFAQKLLLPIGGWAFSSFYVMAELWGSAMVSLMFWRFANDVTSLKESKRFYAMFGFIANIALIVSGETLKVIKGANLIAWLTVLSCFAIIFIYYWLNAYVLTDPRFFNPDDVKKPKKNKEKLSLGESFKYILGSKYLGFIVLLIISYGISINLVEVMWKGQAKLLYPSEAAFSGFMGGLQTWTGIASIVFMLVGANILRRCTWFTAAIATPFMIFVTGLIFFACIVFKDSLAVIVESFGGISILGVITWIGLLQNVLSKGTKYSLFDPTKEMSYIPLDDELKSKGKAAVDVIGGRAGKSGGAAIQFLLLNVIFVGSSLVQLAPIIALVFCIILLIWFFAVSGLNKEFLKLSAEHNQ